MERKARMEGGLLGLLVGDALGVPYEFSPPEAIPPRAAVEFAPPPGFRAAYPGVLPGTWSDDGAQALCLLESLLERGRLDVVDFADRMVRWHRDGHLAVDGHVFDVGVQTRAALLAIERGIAVEEAARVDERANGNGALMRVLPLALWHRGSDEELVRDAMASSIPTHGHVRSQVCCALYCLWARRLLAGAGEAYVEALASLRQQLPLGSPGREELEREVRPNEAPSAQGSGYVVDSFNAARLLLAAHDDYESVVKGAIALGHDTDTTAAIAGGLAGIREGVGAIPARFRDALRGRDLLGPLLDRLLAR